MPIPLFHHELWRDLKAQVTKSYICRSFAGTYASFTRLKNLTGLTVHTGPFNILGVFMRKFEQLSVEIFVRLRWFRVNKNNFQPVESLFRAL